MMIWWRCESFNLDLMRCLITATSQKQLTILCWRWHWCHNTKSDHPAEFILRHFYFFFELRFFLHAWGHRPMLSFTSSAPTPWWTRKNKRTIIIFSQITSSRCQSPHVEAYNCCLHISGGMIPPEYGSVGVRVCQERGTQNEIVSWFIPF